MRSWDKHRNTKYIQKSDVKKGVLVTINKITEETFQNNGRDEEKYVLHFAEDFKPWVPNVGSLEEIATIAGTGDVDRWSGTVIVLYVNPEVEMGGKKVGGIRCRAPKNQEPSQQSVTNPKYIGDDPPPPEDDDIAF